MVSPIHPQGRTGLGGQGSAHGVYPALALVHLDGAGVIDRCRNSVAVFENQRSVVSHRAGTAQGGGGKGIVYCGKGRGVEIGSAGGKRYCSRPVDRTAVKIESGAAEAQSLSGSDVDAPGAVAAGLGGMGDSHILVYFYSALVVHPGSQGAVGVAYPHRSPDRRPAGIHQGTIGYR